MRYIKLFYTLFKIGISQTVTYKANFFSYTVSSVAWGIFSIISILLLTSYVPVVFGWTRNELILLTLLMNIILGIFRTLFDVNFWIFSETIHHGKLDSLLLRPVDSQFQMSLWYMNMGGILRIIIAIAFSIYALFLFHIPVSLISIFGFIVLTFAGIVLLYSISYIILTLTIWHTNLWNLIELLNNFIGLTKYPEAMYQSLNSFIFFALLPIIIVVSTPTKALIQKGSLQDVLTLIILAIVFLTISRFFWKFALKSYTSASG